LLSREVLQFYKVVRMDHDPESSPVLFTKGNHGRLSFSIGKGFRFVPKSDHGMFLSQFDFDEKPIVDYIRPGVSAITPRKRVALSTYAPEARFDPPEGTISPGVMVGIAPGSNAVP